MSEQVEIPDPIDARKHLHLSVSIKLDGVDVTTTAYHANVKGGWIDAWASITNDRGNRVLKHKKIRRYGVVTVEPKS